MRHWSREWVGWYWGFWGVLGFSLTLPATRVAVPFLGPIGVGLGRAVIAAVLSAALLAWRHDRFPKQELRGLLMVVGGVILGFPWLSAWAMERVPATHGAVMLALLPLATAGAGAWLAGERPSGRFWAASLMGSAVIVGYALVEGAGHLVPADGALILSVILAAVGYAEGGRMARTLGGWRVISWALVLSLPVTLLFVLSSVGSVRWAAVPAQAWLSFAYVALGSQFLAFFAWYHGLATGGVGRVSQLQYLQVFLTLGWSALWLHESLTWVSALAAVLVIAAVVWGRSAPVAAREDRENREAAIAGPSSE